MSTFYLPIKPRRPKFRSGFPESDQCLNIYAFGEESRGLSLVRNVRTWSDNSEDRLVFATITGSNYATWETGNIGHVVEGTAGNSSYLRSQVTYGAFVDDTGGSSKSEQTFIIYCHRQAASAGAALIDNGNDRGASIAGLIRFVDPNGSGNLVWNWGGKTEGTSQLTVSWAGSLAIEDLWVLTVGSRGMEIWHNGELLGSNSATPSLNTTGVNNIRFNHLRVYTGVWAESTGNRQLGFIANFKEQLEQSTIARIYNDSWGLIRPRRLWVEKFILPGPAPTVSDTTITLDIAEAEFICKNPFIDSEDSVALEVAEAEYEAPNISLISEDIIALDIAEAEFICKNPFIDSEDSIALEVAEAEYQVPNLSLTSEDIIALNVTEAKYEVPNPSLDSSDSLTLEIAEAEYEVPNISLVSEDIIVLDIAEAEYEAPQPSLASSDTFTLDVAEAEFEAIEPSLDTGISITLGVAEAYLEAIATSIQAEDSISLNTAESIFEAVSPQITSDDLIEISESIAFFDAPAIEISEDWYFTFLPAECIFEAPNISIETGVGISLGLSELLLLAIEIEITTEDDVYYSQKQRIHNALINAVLAGVFLPIRYNSTTHLMTVDDEDSERIYPKTILANDEACSFGPAERFRRSQIFERGIWSWTLLLKFSENALLELFENSFLNTPVVLDRDSENNLDQVTIKLKNAEYLHPVQHQHSKGTEVKYTLEADLMRK